MKLKQLLCLITLFLFCAAPLLTSAQNLNKVPQETTDQNIELRIKNILKVSQRLPNVSVKVREGLVFLEGDVNSEKHLTWIKEIISNTEGVVATIDDSVLNVKPSSVLEPAQEESKVIVAHIKRILPYMASSLIILLLFLILATLARRSAQSFALYKGKNALLANAAGKFVTAAILLLGLYFALRASGLSGLAFTVLGGTGALGIGLGLALKSTFENYASGIMISLKDVFRKGEAVEIAGYQGVIQTVTTRGTTLMDYDGNSITIPNAEVMASSIKNFTRNPKMRLKFTVGIGYEDSIDEVRELIINLFSKHSDKILSDPKPMVSVDALGSATVNLQVQFWIDAKTYSQFRLKSWAIQLVKETLMAHKISMPDDAREIVFASPLKIENSDQDANKGDISTQGKEHQTVANDQREDGIVTSLENQDLMNETHEINQQAQQSEAPEKGQSLI